jgi:HEAT repeat protein
MEKASEIERNTPATENSFSEDDITNARNLLNTFVLAWKNYSLYPEGHIAVLKALENLKDTFAAFFIDNIWIRFTIEKNRLLFGASSHPGLLTDNSSPELFSLLFRDGIHWLEFHRGLPLDELVYFFSVLHKYRMLVEETDGDIVTGLTDGNLEYINFKAVDIFWEDLPLLDFSAINIPRPEPEEAAPPDRPEQAKGLYASSSSGLSVKSIADPSISEFLWEISPSEKIQLQKMVREEENWDNTEDVLDVLLVILRSQTDQQSFSSVLDFTREEVIDAIQQGEFRQLLNLFQSLYQMINRDTATELNWRRPLIERFFLDLSQPDIFDLITAKLILLQDATPEEIQALREILLYFSPSVMLALGPVLLQNGHPAVRKMIMEVMEYLCLKDMSKLETLLDHPDQKLAEELLPLLSKLRGENSYRIFFKMSEHSSEKVREEAVRVLLDRNPQSVLKLFPLIDDPSMKIRRHILAGVAKQKSFVLENLLLKYIIENVSHENTEFILYCYKALGGCCSNKSIPYLHKVLLTRGWNRFVGLGKPVHREGAATALLLLNNQQARDILDKGADSRFKVIRQAIQRATAKHDVSGDSSHG